MAWTQTPGKGLGHSENPHAGHITGGIRGADTSIYASGTTQLHPLGTRRQIGERVFRYAKFGGTVAASRLCAVDASVGHEPAAAGILTNSAGTATDISASGVTQLFLTTSNFDSDDVVNAFADGYLNVTLAGSVHNYIYDIESSTVGSGVTANMIEFNLYASTPTQTAIDSEDTISVHANLYANSVVYTDGTDDVVQGVSQAIQASGDYGWLQTWGPACVFTEADTAIKAGYIATGSVDNAGGVMQLGDANIQSEEDIGSTLTAHPIVGYFMEVVADNAYGVVYLQIAP